MPLRGHLPSLATNPVMFTAHPTKSVASIASSTGAGKAHWNLTAVHWFVRQRGDHTNSSWKLCHWATRKGSSFQEQGLPQQCCFIRSMSREPKEERRDRQLAHYISPASSLLGFRKAQEEGRWCWPHRALQGLIRKSSTALITAKLPTGQATCKSLGGHTAWGVTAPALLPQVLPCSQAGTLAGRSENGDTMYKNHAKISQLWQGQACYSSPVKKFVRRTLRDPTQSFRSNPSAHGGMQPSFCGKHNAEVLGMMTAEEHRAVPVSVGVLNITVCRRNCNLDKLNYSWIYSQMQSFLSLPYCSAIFLSSCGPDQKEVKRFLPWKERCIHFPCHVSFLTYRAAKIEI